MSNTIYVGNMNYQTSEDNLNELFGQYGDVVSTKIISDQYTGKSKGFGFIEMGDAEAVSSAISELNGKEYDGRQLKVNVATDKPRRERNMY
jgi:RNA recognition motif-containing protein